MTTGARSAREVAEAFGAAMQESISCVTDASFCYPQAYPLFRRHVLALAGGDVVELDSEDGLHLFATHEYVVTEDGGGFRVQTAGYIYGVDADDIGGELLSYHWHPTGTSWYQEPHVHVHEKRFRHLPTGRISLEAVLRFLIEELAVRPRRDNWRDILARNEAAFKRQRHWA